MVFLPASQNCLRYLENLNKSYFNISTRILQWTQESCMNLRITPAVYTNFIIVFLLSKSCQNTVKLNCVCMNASCRV